MASITVNEISRNYSYAIAPSSYATVALPITSCWGPGYFDPNTLMSECRAFDDKKDWDAENHSDMLDRTAWRRFPATQAGIEQFVASYRGPIANYRLCNDYSYQMAITFLTAGYDVLTCRLSPGAKSSAAFVLKGSTKDSKGQYNNMVTVTAKYPGSFGDSIRVEFKNIGFMLNTSSGHSWAYYWNMIVYIVDTSGTKKAVENKTFVFDIDNTTDSTPHWREISSDFVDLGVMGNIPDFKVEADGSTSRVSLAEINSYEANPDKSHNYAVLSGGSDMGAIPTVPNDWTASGVSDENKITYQKLNLLADAKKWSELRYRYNGTLDENVNTGFTYAAVERNYPLAFDYLSGNTDDVAEAVASYMDIEKGTDKYNELKEIIGRYDLGMMDVAKAEAIRFREWIFTHLVGINGRDGYEGVYDLLKDRLAYNPNRIISPGWDDQDFLYLMGADDTAYLCSNAWGIRTTSPIHRKLMDTAYFSRCGTAMLDIPRSLDKKFVYNDTSEDFRDWGYAQKLARYVPDNANFQSDVMLYHTHSALFTCWGRYQYQGMARQTQVPPAFLAIMIQRAMILNQAAQYEWLLPTDRKQNLKIGRMDYDIPKKFLDIWQTTEGVGVNCITFLPDMGTTLWGNSTLFEVPPATYQALANLSTRYLFNAIEDVIFRVGVSITFQYTNQEAFTTFRVGCTPILETMKNQGAIRDYVIKMSEDINADGVVNANSVLGKIWLTVNGVIQDITVDLIAMPPNVSLDQFRD